MKKTYIAPEIAVYDVETSGMLCLSGSHSGDADEAAHARELQEDAWNVILGASLIDDD